MKKFFSIVPLVGLALVVMGIGLYYLENYHKPKEPQKQIKIATTIFPIYDITRNITKDQDIEVINILPVGTSPHSFNPTPQDIKNAQNVDIAFLVGAEIDPWAENIFEKSDTSTVDLSKNINLKNFETNYVHSQDEEEEHEDEHNHENGNPHYWLSVKNARILAQDIANELISNTQMDETQINQNLEAYMHQLDSLEEELLKSRNLLDEISILTFHDAFGYLAQETGFEVAGVIEAFPGKSPSPSQMNSISNIIHTKGIKAIYIEPQLSEDVAVTIASDNELKIGILDPLGGTQGRDSFIKLIQYNINEIIRTNG